MTSFVEWDSTDQDVLYALIDAEGTINELTDIQDEVRAILDTVPYPVSVVLEFESDRVVRGLAAHLADVSRHPVLYHDRLRLLILIIKSDLQKRIGTVFMSLVKCPVRMVRTPDEALEVLSQLI